MPLEELLESLRHRSALSVSHFVFQFLALSFPSLPFPFPSLTFPTLPFPSPSLSSVHLSHFPYPFFLVKIPIIQDPPTIFFTLILRIAPIPIHHFYSTSSSPPYITLILQHIPIPVPSFLKILLPPHITLILQPLLPFSDPTVPASAIPDRFQPLNGLRHQLYPHSRPHLIEHKPTHREKPRQSLCTTVTPSPPPGSDRADITPRFSNSSILRRQVRASLHTTEWEVLPKVLDLSPLLSPFYHRPSHPPPPPEPTHIFPLSSLPFPYPS